MPPLLARLCLAVTLGASAGLACTAHTPPPADPHAGEVLLRYRLGPQQYRQHVTGAFKTTDGALKIEMTGELSLTVIGTMLKLEYAVADVQQADATGMFQPELESGAPLDLAARLRSARGAQILDVRGVVDTAASKQQPENPKPEDETLGALFGLPAHLPEAPLVLGVPVTVTRTDTEEFAALELAHEIDTTYTLRALTVEQGRRIAELDIHAEWAGAREVSRELLTIDGTRDDTLTFDVDAQVPLRSTTRSTYAITLGGHKNEIAMDITSTFTPP